jgi:hypothetical protein
MEMVKSFSRRSLFWIIFFMTLLCVGVDAALYLGLDSLSGKLSGLIGGAELTGYKDFVAELSGWLNRVNQYYLPVSIGFCLLFALIMWLCIHLSFMKVPAGAVPMPRPKPARTSQKSEETEKDQGHDHRLFLHLLSVLQRDGRLLDFLTENIEPYEDDQIGAAVRNIHENCKKVVDNYLVSEPILAQEEDEDILIEPGFDPNQIKLTGNVTGSPPFKGTVRHRGWRAKKLDLPALSGVRDPAIIAPAEVEIL